MFRVSKLTHPLDKLIRYIYMYHISMLFYVWYYVIKRIPISILKTICWTRYLGCSNIDIFIFVGANKAETHYLPQGVHKFPFEFFVPTGCPTTYEGSIGRVRTYVSATLEKLWVADISTLKPFTVINPLDLNKDPRAKVTALSN